MAERDGDKIQMTMRSNQMPLDLVETLKMDAPAQDPCHVLSVAWVFKALLAGIPEGILGSRVLYQVLVDISYGRPPYISDGPAPRRPDGCLEGLSAWEDLLTRTIALAMLALTSKMHLELICGVFGLCDSLLHETQREIEIAWWRSIRSKERRPSSWVAGLLDVDRLSRTLGPMLTNGAAEEEDFYNEVPSALKGERVVRMMLEQWRGVSRQLRWWEHCGCPPERIVLQPNEEERK